MQYNAVKYYTTQYNNIIQCNSIHYNTTQYNAIQCITLQQNTIQYNTMQCTTIQYITIQYKTLQYNIIALYITGRDVAVLFTVVQNCSLERTVQIHLVSLNYL